MMRVPTAAMIKPVTHTIMIEELPASREVASNESAAGSKSVI
jgi:hypothetical protein